MAARGPGRSCRYDPYVRHRLPDSASSPPCERPRTDRHSTPRVVLLPFRRCSNPCRSTKAAHATDPPEADRREPCLLRKRDIAHRDLSTATRRSGQDFCEKVVARIGPRHHKGRIDSDRPVASPITSRDEIFISCRCGAGAFSRLGFSRTGPRNIRFSVTTCPNNSRDARLDRNRAANTPRFSKTI